MQFACLTVAQQQCMKFVLLDEHAAAMHAILVLDDRSAGMATMISAIFSKRKEEVLRSQ